MSTLNESFESMSRVALRVKAERDILLDACNTALHGFRSYQFGNASTEFAAEMADMLEAVIKEVSQ